LGDHKWLHRQTQRIVAKGTSCTQSAFKAGNGTFLFIGPGPKGQGFKAMFKLKASMPQARKLAATDPKRFEIGSTDWVTARFTSEDPLPKRIWGKWLAESYEVTCGGSRKAKKAKGTRRSGRSVG
jgi:hypothetical protein